MTFCFLIGVHDRNKIVFKCLQSDKELEMELGLHDKY